MTYARRVLASPWTLVVLTATYGATLVRDTVDAAGTWPVLWRGALSTLVITAALSYTHTILTTRRADAD